MLLKDRADSAGEAATEECGLALICTASEGSLLCFWLAGVMVSGAAR